MPRDLFAEQNSSKSQPKDLLADMSANEENTQNPSLLNRAGDYVDRNINKPLERAVINPAKEFLEGTGQGFVNVIPGTYDLARYGLNKLPGVNLPYAKPLDVVPDTLPASAGNIASFFMAPGGYGAGGVNSIIKGAMSIPLIAKTLKMASKIAGKNPLTQETAKSVAKNALLGGIYNPEDPEKGLLTGGLLGSVPPPIAKAATAGVNALKPSNLFRGTLTPEELQKNLEITQGTQTGLGDVIGSPFLKRLQENVLTKIPTSGATDIMQNTGAEVVDRGHNILNKLLGENNGEDVQQILHDTLQDAFKEHQADKNAYYAKANQHADSVGLKLDLSDFSKNAQKYSDAIKNTNILKYEPDLASLFNKLQAYKNPANSPRLEEANLLKGRLNHLEETYKQSPNPLDRHAAKVFGDLSKSLKSDINTSIENSGSKELKDYYQEAEKNYADNFSPFLDKEIYKFSNGNADPDMLISTFLKTGKSNDRANLLNKLMEKLPSDKKDLLGYGYLSRAIDENNVVNPLTIKSLLSKKSLGSRQFNALFPNEQTRNELLNYVKLVDKNTHALDLMSNPKTGQMNMDILPLLSKGKTGLVAKMLGARPLTNALTSEKVRNSLVKKMIENTN